MDKRRTAVGSLPAEFYVALPDNPLIPISGMFPSSSEAELHLVWLQRRFPDAELVARITLLERCN